MSYIRTCPYCGTQLGINELSIEKTASRCPHCGKILLLTDYGATVKKPYVYKCHKCGEESIYEYRVPFVKCDKCGTLYVTAPKGNSMIEADLLAKGDKGLLPYKKKEDKYIARRNKWRMLTTKTKVALYVCLVAILGIACGTYFLLRPIPIEKTQAYAQMEGLWQEFRDKNPYNFQVVGLKHYDDNSYVAIISEPTEGVTEDHLRKVFKKYHCEFRTFKKEIGYDGWLRDAVVSFNGASEKDIPKIAQKLFTVLYGTDYKAEFMDFSIVPEHIAFSDKDLNFQVTEEELRQWFITDQEPLMELEDNTKETTLKDCLKNTDTDIQMLMSKTPGFIVWVMNTGYCDTEKFRVAARKFSIDSDIIFGAIATDERVAIIARERCIPLYELPPMRQETLMLLASTEEDELAQSYERTTLFAGKQKGGKDFAPIYLSDELWHTEYGNILNITDQMLKSWSEDGMIEYTEFGYPKPVDWTFNVGVSGDLKVSELTYNWNTDGVGYEVEDGEYTIFALNRTGSLPVSYIPGDAEGISDNDPVYQAEDKAYDFFSNLSTPELVKVVQYVAMYQIFHNLNVHCIGYPTDENVVAEVPERLVEQARKTLSAVANFDVSQKTAIGTFYGVKAVSKTEYFENSKYTHGFSIGAEKYLVCQGRTQLAQLAKAAYLIDKIDEVCDALSYIKADGEFMDCLPRYLLDRNGADLSYNGNAARVPSLVFDGSSQRHFGSYEDRIYLALSALGTHGFDLQEFNYIIGDISVEESKELYLEVNKDKSKTWMKCPTIVESWNSKDSVNSVGGHNLNSKVTRFRIAKDLKPGQTREIVVNGQKVIEISRADMYAHGTDPRYLRRVGRLGNSNLLTREIPVRAKADVLKGVTERTSRGCNVTDHLTIKAKGTAFEIEGRKVTLTELFDYLADNMSHGTSPVKEIEIVGFDRAGTEVSAIIDGISYHMPKGQHANLAKAKYDFASHTVDYVGDKAVIKIPIKAGKVEYGNSSQVVQAGFGGTSSKVRALDVKEGEFVFEVPKSKVQVVLEMLKSFFQEKGQFFDQLRLRNKMRQYDISPSDCQERHHLKVAKLNIKNLNNNLPYVWIIQEENIA